MAGRYHYWTRLMRMNLKELAHLRLATLMQAVFMMVNNIIFFSFWVLLFRHVDSIRGVSIDDMGFLYAVACTSFGLCVLLFGGAFQLSDIISKGALDIYLTQPKNAHLQALTSKTYVFGLGDIISGALLLGFFFGGHAQSWLYWGASSIIGAALITACFSIFHSLIFFLPRSNELCAQLFEFFLSFAVYPTNIFSQPVRLFVLTVMPAGFVAFIPMLAHQHRDPSLLALAALAALLFACLARTIFRSGIRRYTSGSSFVQIR